MGSNRYRDAKREAQGAERGRSRGDAPDHFRPPCQAPDNILALLRATWAKRQHLTDRERSIIFSCLRRAEKGALSPAQLDAAKAIGKSLGVGFDDPPVEAPNAKTAHPWGPLPLKPPGR